MIPRSPSSIPSEIKTKDPNTCRVSTTSTSRSTNLWTPVARGPASRSGPQTQYLEAAPCCGGRCSCGPSWPPPNSEHGEHGELLHVVNMARGDLLSTASGETRFLLVNVLPASDASLVKNTTLGETRHLVNCR